MVDGQSTDRLRVGNFNERVWGDLRERDQCRGGALLRAEAKLGGRQTDL